MLGLGSKSALGAGKESTFGTGVVPALSWPIKSETLTADRASVQSGTLTGSPFISSSALGIKNANGGVVMENDAKIVGHPMALWNGLNGVTSVTFASLNYLNAAAPSGTPGTGGTIAAGTYYYKVAPVLIRTVDSLKTILTATASSTAQVIASTGTCALSWSNPSAFLPGFTQYGTAIYRTDVGGASGTEVYLHTLVGTGTTYTDTGAVVLGTALPLTATLYRHRMIGLAAASGVERVNPFSVTVNKDNGDAERYLGNRMNEMTITSSGGDSAMEVSFSMIGRTVEKVAEFTPVISYSEPILGWKGAGFVNGLSPCLFAEAFTITGNNNLQAIPGFCATPYNRDSSSGTRLVTGSFTRAFENHEFWDYVQSGSEFSLQFNCYGEPTRQNGFVDLATSVNPVAIPFPNFMEIDLFSCRANKAGGNVAGPEYIKEVVEFTAFPNTTQATEMRITLCNTVSSYDV